MAAIKSDRTFFASRIVEGIFLAAYLLRKAERQFRQVAFGNPFFLASKLDWRQGMAAAWTFRGQNNGIGGSRIGRCHKC